jgi:hypothetical protein
MSKLIEDSLRIIGEFSKIGFVRIYPQFNKDDNEEIFDYSTLQPFDKIMIKVLGRWEISFFGYHENNGYHVMNGDWFCKKDIIPYNYETKHLLGTTNEKPEKYI